MDRAVYWLYRAFAAVICALPLRVGWRAGWFLGFCGYYLAWPYRRLVLRNLRIAFGDEKSPHELRALAHAHFATLGANLFSSIKLPTFSRDVIESLVTVEGIGTLDAAVDAGAGMVMVISHIGNWEMFGQLSPIIFRCKVGTIYQRLGNPFLDGEVRRDRARLGLEVFERKEGFAAASKFIREGGACGVLVDQHAGDAGLWCPFFNRLASTSTLAATLALRTGGWLVPAAVYTDGPARWRLRILDPINSSARTTEGITVQINEVLESQIRRQPEDWFWVHNRWKTPRPKFLLATYKRGVAIQAETNPKSAATSEARPGQKSLNPKSFQPFRILIRGSNWLGDAVMSAPAVRAVKRGRPDAHVTILTPAKLADFWRTVNEVDDVIAIEPGKSVFAVARKVRGGKFEAAILFPNSLRVALEVWLAGMPRRVGYHGHHRVALLNQVFREKKKKNAPTGPRHQAHHYLALAEFVGASIGNALATGCGSQLSTLNSQPILGLCVGAEYGPAKRWLPERFAEVMRLADERYRCDWRIFGVAKDRDVADAIVAAAGIPCVDLIGKTTLAQLIAELRTCDLLVTNDTGTMHLAAHIGVPVVAIFGSTEPALTGPMGQQHRVLRHHVECSPCFLRECPIDFRCMKAVSVEEVVAAIDEKLGNLSPGGDACGAEHRTSNIEHRTSKE